MTTVTLNMFDELNEVELSRTIDGSNLMVNDINASLGMECHKIGTDSQIEKNLNLWISERGNNQHETILTLISWKINK